MAFGTPCSFPVAVGTTAVLLTSAFIILQVFTIACIEDAAPVRISSIVAGTLQCLVAIVIAILSLDHRVNSGLTHDEIQKQLRLRFVIATAFVVTAATASLTTLMLLKESPAQDEAFIMGISPSLMLVICAALLGFAFACQLAFLLSVFLSKRKSLLERASEMLHSGFHPKQGNTLRKNRPCYHTADDRHHQSFETNTSGSPPSRSASFDGKSGLASSVGSVSSRTRLLSQREKRRPDSLDRSLSHTSRDSSFDSWDTSSVDNFYRQTVLGATAQPKRQFLETIPASPLSSCIPSPMIGQAFTTRHSTREHSPSYGPLTGSSISLGCESNPSEAHIHPLFRSGCSELPSGVTPGTSVLASPVAGQIISARSSVRSLPRSRSGSASTALGSRSCEEVSMVPPPMPARVAGAGNRYDYHGYHRTLHSPNPEGMWI